MNEKALIAMSGGVDSSVAALIMKEKGYDCIGATMKLFEYDDICTSEKTCCSLSDVEDARSVAGKLDMPYFVFNYKSKFKEEVIDRFVKAYENGSTPNPCIDCNRYMKFDKLFVRAKELDYDYIVTGHYVRVEYSEKLKRYLLKKAVDDKKDQSYVLYFMTQEQLKHAKFPLGELTKPEVRKIAEDNGFINSNKHDSQDICFVPDGDYSGFIEKNTGKKYPPGEFVDMDGNVLGKHKGIISYTIGQRKGLGLSLKAPMYVYSKNVKANKVILCEDKDLFSTSLKANNINLISVEKIEGSVRLKAKIRYSQKEQWAIVNQIDEDTLNIEFESPQRAITKGQAVVLYDGDIVVGGGTIV